MGCVLATLVTCGRADEQRDVCEGTCCTGACDPCADGACEDTDALGWGPPVLLWWGDAATPAPGCPAWAPEVVYEGIDGLSAEQRCPSCACGPAACKLPAGLVVWDEFMCNAHDVPDPTFTTFPAPDPWDGSCVTHPTIPAGSFRSIRFLSTTLSPCTPVTGPEPMVAEPVWATHARACGEGNTPAEESVPREERVTPEGFRECLWRRGEPGPCPTHYPERRVFHEDIESSLGCTECACGEPMEGSCVAVVRLFHRPECDMTPGHSGGTAMGLHNAPCKGWLDGPSPITVGSISAKWNEQDPGRCEPSGGLPRGEVWTNEQTTFCCEGMR
ncbi:uncharacterized protein CMC5_052600 [Chondromyces crocatus]|uniref:Uncharacterized protein n=2 Tax=Chondromyces crocatus TaxID=52 RepID=A0A0K1EJR3_CHOCO|nr:uncharacterized protein CMC5_052600 [Chondromyces crocatus]